MQVEKYLKNYIDGKLCKPSSGKYIDNIEPATGNLYSYIPDSTKEDIDLAVQAAEKAFPIW